MNEQTPQQNREYHYTVSRIMETSGEDVGRVKDKSTARELAMREQRSRENGAVHGTMEDINRRKENGLEPWLQDDVAWRTDTELKRTVAAEALRSSIVNSDMAAAVVGDPDDNFGSITKVVDNQKRIVKVVVDDLDNLKATAEKRREAVKTIEDIDNSHAA